MAEVSLQEAFQLAVEHHEAGRLAEAEQIYRAILGEVPGEPEVLHKLAILGLQVGRADVAVELFGQALVAAPDDPMIHNNLGYALQVLGRPQEAAAHLRHAVALRPDYADAYNNLGNSLNALGHSEEAIECFRQALRLNPDAIAPHGNLVGALRRVGRHDEALAAGLAGAQQHPHHSEIFNNLGDVLFIMRRYEEALGAFSRAVELNPNLPEAHYNAGNALNKLGQFDLAAQAYRRAAELRPSLLEAHNNLGLIQFQNGQLDEAQASFRRVLSSDPSDGAALLNLGNVLKDLGCIDEAVESYRGALASAEDELKAHSNLLLVTHYSAAQDPAELFAEHRRWNERFAKPLANSEKFLNSRASGRRLRVGYVTPDFRDHPVGRFMQPLLENHDRFEVEVFAYVDVLHEDGVTAVLKPLVDFWCNTHGRSDEQVAELVRNDEIDILVDLAGHTGGCRLGVFARQVAPVQVTYLGYPNTSGLDTIQYRLTDSLADPPGESDALHSEELVRLDPCAWCCPVLPDVPVVVRRSGPVVFGCCNTTAKVSDGVVRLWARVLAQLPEAQLVLKATGWINAGARQRVLGIMASFGVAAERVRFARRVPGYHEHFEFISQIDIALDTFPYHGTSTTCDALWMGLPVVTLAGDIHVSRVGVSLLTALGHPEWIAESEEEYVAKAVELARDRERLASQRASLRDELRASPLGDAGALAGRVEAAFRKMWQRWCAANSQS